MISSLHTSSSSQLTPAANHQIPVASSRCGTVRNRRTDEFAKSVDLGFGLLQFFVCKKKTKKLEWMLYLFIEKKWFHVSLLQ
jgi:hypothetical protein